ncbi:MAG: peptide-methionine (R)-S-oxide reductase [Gammaproteobacteria bacterium]|jgi:peptide-methionine (R)-S-oxide reductase
MKRRNVLASAIGLFTLPILTSNSQRAQAAMDSASVDSIQSQWRKLLAESAKVAKDSKPLDRAPSSWRKELPQDAYEVLFEEDTERPFSSNLNEEKRPGVFVCRACDLPLFSSDMKYDSGTGWPSFFTTISDHVATKRDFKLIWPRTEYHCVKCGGHQGHLFDDGPEPTSNRWCNNGLALRFIPVESA